VNLRSLKQSSGMLLISTVLLVGNLRDASAAESVRDSGKQDVTTVLTVPVDTGIEAFFFYDPIRQVLSGSVLSPSGKFSVSYRAQLSTMFKKANAEPIKDARFLFVSGQARLLPVNLKGIKQRVAQQAIYVAEVTTGRVVALGIPWSPTWRTEAPGRKVELIPLDARTVRPAIPD